MSSVVKSGIILGVLVEIWSYLYVSAGWHRSPATFNLFWVVILIEIGVLIWALRGTAAQGRGYGGQVVAGTAISVVGAVLVLIGSYVCMTMVFPNYSKEVCDMQAAAMRAAGRPEAEIQQLVDMSMKAPPALPAITGAIGTVVTGLLCSLIIGAFVRAKKPQAA
jgi:hypothetical protein